MIGMILESFINLVNLMGFNVLYNDFLGWILIVNVFVWFGNFSYLGNKGLCGLLLIIFCELVLLLVFVVVVMYMIWCLLSVLVLIVIFVVGVIVFGVILIMLVSIWVMWK